MIRYVTRWALSTGIHRVDGKYTHDGKYFSSPRCGLVAAREAFETEEAAQAEAKRLATRRAAALLKQIAKFNDPKWKSKVVQC